MMLVSPGESGAGFWGTAEPGNHRVGLGVHFVDTEDWEVLPESRRAVTSLSFNLMVRVGALGGTVA